MFKKIFFAIVFQGSAMLLGLSPVEGFAQEGVLKIHVTDSINKEAISFAGVRLENGTVLAGSGQTDIAGDLTLKNLAPGTYTMTTMYAGYPKNLIGGVLIKNHETTYLDVRLSSTVKKEFVFTIYIKDLIDPGTVIGKKYDYTEIKTSAVDPMTLLGTSGTETKPGISPSFRGARPDANVIYIDGQRVIGSALLPKMGIQEMSVKLGGVPAMYGDGTGAFIEIETRSGLVSPTRR